MLASNPWMGVIEEPRRGLAAKSRILMRCAARGYVLLGWLVVWGRDEEELQEKG